MIYDISPPISPRLAVWPGDTPPTREVLLERRRGDNITLSTLAMDLPSINVTCRVIWAAVKC
ncbi:MAG: hypothetical protein EBV06_02970 [Planctomycetia bacterium]|nr:hypothetical protein [Planctomycetia bacterium]